MLEPLDPPVVKRLALEALETELIFPSPHAVEEMQKDNLTIQDARNVLRGGVVDPGEFVNGSWRYRIRTQRMAFVVAFDLEVDPVEAWIVTAWRYKP